MASIALKPQTHSAEDYLASEVEADTRHEFRNGEIVEIAGGTPEHNEIARMLSFLLTGQLRRQPYSIFVSDQRLWLSDADLYTYPDVMVTQKPATLQTGRKDTVLNPILIAEVLSTSTQSYDRGDKFAAYRTSETFQEYVLIDQCRPQVEHYVKQAENQWLLTTYSGLESHFTLTSVAIDIAMEELYEAISFEKTTEDSESR